MESCYKFLIIFILFSTQAFAKIVISDESIKLQKVWESPKSSLKQKIKIIYHDFKEPFPWGINLWKAYNHAWDTYYDIEFGKETTLKDRALLRMYSNKGLTSVLGLGMLSVLSVVALGKMGLLPTPISPSAIKPPFEALKILGLESEDLEGETSEKQETTIKGAYKHLALVKHPDKVRTPEAVQAFQNLLDAYVTLLDHYKLSR